MTALLPRLFGDITDWFDIGFPRMMPAIRFEDKITDKEYVLRAELPGLASDKDVQITVLDKVLTVKAERRQQQKGLHHSEFRYGSLQRSVRLPANADDAGIKAAYHNGVLEITVPLTAPLPASHQIAVTAE